MDTEIKWTNGAYLHCMHTFCFPCIFQWATYLCNNVCPVCNSVFHEIIERDGTRHSLKGVFLSLFSFFFFFLFSLSLYLHTHTHTHLTLTHSPHPLTLSHSHSQFYSLTTHSTLTPHYTLTPSHSTLTNATLTLTLIHTTLSLTLTHSHYTLTHALTHSLTTLTHSYSTLSTPHSLTHTHSHSHSYLTLTPTLLSYSHSPTLLSIFLLFLHCRSNCTRHTYH
jgi:Zinc finger, C3HC4 type (RING finger)